MLLESVFLGYPEYRVLLIQNINAVLQMLVNHWTQKLKLLDCESQQYASTLHTLIMWKRHTLSCTWNTAHIGRTFFFLFFFKMVTMYVNTQQQGTPHSVLSQ